MRLSGDFETCSAGNLARMGAWKYARQPTTRILCFSWAVEDGEPDLWFPPDPPPRRLLKTIEAGCEFHAWNAQFEFNIWNVVGVLHGLPPLPVERFFCTMARALYWGVPPKLEQAALVVGTNVRKDKAGAALMRKMSAPLDKTEGVELQWLDRDEPDLLINLGEYCRQDVRTERAIARRLKPMPTVERQLWLLDQRMNMRGLRVDVDAVWRMRRVVDSELKRLGGKLRELTGGAITSLTQTKALLEWLKEDGVKIDSLGKNVLPLVLKDPLEPHQRAIIEIYQEGAKTSTSKLKSMESFCGADGRVRGLVQYGGALRTLRWAGRGVQIQNYPRPSKEINAKRALLDILDGADDAELIELRHGRPMDVVSQCLRGCYVPDAGRAFAVADFSAVEARVVAWLAGQDNILDAFRAGVDVYVLTASAVGSDSRMLGKVLVLACGFGIGAKRFRATAAAPPYNIALTEDAAKDNVYAWRKLNNQTRSLWYKIDDVVRMVIAERVVDRWASVGAHLAFRMGKDGSQFHDCLLMRLPSGRPIVYRNASLDTVLDDDGVEHEAVIRYDGLDFSKKWSRIRTWGGKLCIAGYTPVLTDRGWVPLANVKASDLIWDGDAWRRHAGLVFQGVRSVIGLNGVDLTPDHRILTTEGWRNAAQAQLDRSFWLPVRLPDRDARAWLQRQKRAVGSRVRELWKQTDITWQGYSSQRATWPAWLSSLFHARAQSDTRHESTPGVLRLAINARSLPVADASGVEELRRPWNYGLRSVGNVRDFLGRHGVGLSIWAFHRPHRQQRPLRAGKLPLGDNDAAGAKPTPVITMPPRQGVCAVYDLVNCGPHHRFVVAGSNGPALVSNCENATQATARDLLADAMLRLDDGSDDLDVTIHDELIAEPPVDRADKRLEQMLAAMSAVPDWARGLPLKAEGAVMTRYGKS